MSLVPTVNSSTSQLVVFYCVIGIPGRQFNIESPARSQCKSLRLSTVLRVTVERQEAKQVKSAINESG
jgi:hypothetical protein